MRAKGKASFSKDSTVSSGFEAEFWLASDKLRTHMDAAEPDGESRTIMESPEDPHGGNGAERHGQQKIANWVNAETLIALAHRRSATPAAI